MDKKINRAIEALEKINDELLADKDETLMQHTKQDDEVDRIQKELLKEDKNYDKKRKMYA